MPITKPIPSYDCANDTINISVTPPGGTASGQPIVLLTSPNGYRFSRPFGYPTVFRFDELPNGNYRLEVSGLENDFVEFTVNCSRPVEPQLGVTSTHGITCHPDGYGIITINVATTSPISAAGYEITVDLAVLNAQNTNPPLATAIFQSTTASSGTVEFRGLLDNVYTARLRDQAGATSNNSGIQLSCNNYRRFEINDIILVSAREDGTAPGSADVYARPTTGGAVDTTIVIEGNVKVRGAATPTTWIPFFNRGTFVSNRFDSLPAGDYTVTLRFNTPQPNLERDFSILEEVAPVQIGEQLSFLPWVKHKLGRAAGPIAGTLRPTISLLLTTQVSDGNAQPQEEVTTTQLELYGPGDVVGLTPAAILRTTPAAETQNFSPLHLPSIEFREEDLPWRYSPEAVTANNQVRPWCFLLVLEEDEFTTLPQNAAPLPGIAVKAGVPQPDFNQLSLLAHVQVNQVLETTPEAVEAFLAGPLQQNPSLAFSRLFSSRRLRPNTRYAAFLLPAYEAGRQAGLGEAVTVTGVTDPAWPASTTALSTAARSFPVYHQWRFQTGTGSDFESLARLLQPSTIGTNTTNQLRVSTPIVGGGSNAGVFTLALPGVLEPLAMADETLPAAIAQNMYHALEPGFIPGLVGSGGRPVIVPPLYGRAYMNSPVLADPLTDSGLDAWPGQVNLDPRYRVIAALGSQLVQEQQEEYVRRAWDQVQDVLVANLNLRGLQFGLETSASLRRQNLPFEAASSVAGLSAPDASESLRSGALAAVDPAPATSMANYGLQMTALALPRVRLATTGLSARETIRRSSLPLGAFSPTFRRLLRPFGPYQVNLVGRPLRPTQQPAPETQQAPLGPGTSLRQRDELLVRLQSGQVRASALKDSLIRAYQFDDAALNLLLAQEGALPTTLRVLDEQGYREVVDADTVAKFGTAFSSLRTQTRFRTLDSPQPQLDIFALKSGMVAGTDPERVLPARAKRGLTTVPKFVVGDFEAADFAAEDFLLDEVLEGATIAASPPQMIALSGQASDAAVINEQTDGARAVAVAIPDAIASINSPIKPVTVSPVFKDPLGEQLSRRHPELLLPGLADFPANTVALMQINRAFIEAYLLGANHALGSELQWRDFPVDLRSSFFRQFWNVGDYLNTLPVAAATPTALAAREESLRDVAPLHTWNGNTLGGNPGAGLGAQVVVVIRAELLLRFPNIVICAQPAIVDTAGKIVPDQTASVTRYPVYRLPVGQDLVALAFDLTTAEVTGADPTYPDGFFFVFLERPSEPQFGLDKAESGADLTQDDLSSWNNLSWEYLGVAEGSNLVISPTARPQASADPVPRVTTSAELAYVLFQQPVMVAIPAKSFI